MEAILCAVLRKSLAFCASPPLIVTVLVLGGVCALAYRPSPPVKTLVQTEVRPAEKIVAGAGAAKRFRNRMASVLTQKNAEIVRANTARCRAEAALCKSQKELKAARQLIERYREELAYVDELSAKLRKEDR